MVVKVKELEYDSLKVVRYSKIAKKNNQIWPPNRWNLTNIGIYNCFILSPCAFDVRYVSLQF